MGGKHYSIKGYLRSPEGTAYLMIAPAVILMLLLVGYSFLFSLYLSVSNARVGQPSSFTGLENFIKLSRSNLFQTAFKNSLIFTFSSVVVKLILGIALALILNKNLRGRKFFRGAILLPWVIPSVLSTLGWKWMFDPLYSVINWPLIKIGLIETGIQWLGKPHLAMISIITVNVWRGTPFFAVNFLAGLIAIPREIYEAAEADGAGAFDKFWYITIPLLKPVLATVLLFSTVMTISDFNIVYSLTRGGPMDSTHLFATLAYQVGLTTGYIGRGAAISLFIFPVLVTVVYFQLRLMRRKWEW